MAPKEREVIDVARELNALLSNAVRFHRPERIVGPMLSLVIKVGEVLQIGQMPGKTCSTEYQASGAVLVGLRCRQTALELKSIVKKASAGPDQFYLDRAQSRSRAEGGIF